MLAYTVIGSFKCSTILSNFFFDTKNTLIERRNLINDKVYFEISKHPELLKLIINVFKTR